MTVTTTVPDTAALAALRVLFPATEPIWVTETSYERVGPIWCVMLLRRDERGDWRLLRYRFDIPSGTLNFSGDMPAPADRVTDIRQQGRLLFADA